MWAKLLGKSTPTTTTGSAGAKIISIGTNAFQLGPMRLRQRPFATARSEAMSQNIRCKTMRHQPVKQINQVRCRRRTGTTMDLAERPKVTGALVGVDGFKDAGPADSVRRIFTITNMFRRERAKSINPKISASHQMSPSCRDWTRVVIFSTRCRRQNPAPANYRSISDANARTRQSARSTTTFGWEFCC